MASFKEKCNEIEEIIKMKIEQGDQLSLQEAHFLQKDIDEVLKSARGTLTEYGQETLKERMKA